MAGQQQRRQTHNYGCGNQERADAIASRVALSPSACLARTRRLERAGFIRGYHARLDPFRLDIGLVLFVEVTLGGHRSGESARFETAIGAIPEFVEASHVSGDFDYLLRSSSLTWRNGRTFGIDWSAAIWASIGSPPTR